MRETGTSLTKEDLQRAVEWLGSDEYAKQEADNYKASMQMVEAQQQRLIVNAITGNLKKINEMKKWQIIERWKTMNWIMDLLFLSKMFRFNPNKEDGKK